ncbi:hypothetical protein RHMOL_Rhmol12G0068500 [Rhododendron molle]|uniref:Uncharacterized protein n=1 Tax=Rhododendron molle TaxID=49168 RepID=A0ACC0LFI1_RHOML|nr:hypothetical protein RHMOL_Rhmol12G0068500 [Rhododendron molle]
MEPEIFVVATATTPPRSILGHQGRTEDDCGGDGHEGVIAEGDKSWAWWQYVFLLLGFIFRYIFRLFSADSYKKKDSDFEADHLQQDDQIASVSETEEENHEFVFGFRFQNSGTEHSVSRENSLNHNTSKYHQFTSTKDYRGFIEEPETVSCSVQELFLSPNDQNSWEFDSKANKSIISAKTEDSVFQENPRSSKTKDVKGFIEEPERITFRLQDFSVRLNDFPNAENGNQDSGEFNSKENNSITCRETEDSVFQSNSPNPKTSKHQFISNQDFWGFVENPEVIQDFSVGPKDFQIVDNGKPDFDEFYSEAENSVSEAEDSVTPEQGIFSSDCYFQGKRETTGLEINHSCVENSSQEVGLNSRNPFWCFDFDFEPKTSVSSEEEDSITSDYFANSFVDEEPENSNLEFTEEIPNPAEISFLEPRASCTDDEFIEFEPDFQDSAKSEPEDLRETEEEGKSEELKSREKSCDYDYEDDDDDDDDLFGDVLLKHQESVEQMKAEMKNAKGKGMLPTILEESESPPKVVEDLRPLMRIDEKFEHKDRLEEIQKVYKGYAEKMRKLDVLNYQTLHGISFLQLKDQIHRGSAQKSSVSAIKSLLLPNLLQVKLRRIFVDPTLKSITDLHQNLELVYVGHACLSWEILHWQYGKAMEMLEDEGEGNMSSYNHVAGEFQQFRVLLERFVENEPFQGPRVQTYAKNRCDIRSILQVPVIKEDSLKDKKDSTVWEDYEVSAAMLTHVIDESMRVFWEFLEADKDEANVSLKGIQSTNHVDLQDPSDSEFLMNINTILQKKEKRLKDLLRSRNCLVKKFQKHQESRLSGALLFAQVELKLVSRVLNMSRLTTDQLVWCQKKLNKISIVNRKIQLEPSFLLFPF